MSAKTNDNVYLAAGGFALLATCVWAFLQQSGISDFQAPVNAPTSGQLYEPAPLSLPAAESQRWSAAPSQPAGENWLFDVFTPPIIYYNTETKRFTVTVPQLAVVRDDGELPPLPEPEPDSFGLTLLKVEQPLFRLQLVGWVGEGPNARGNFLNVLTGDVIFGTTGKKLPDLNLEIVSFSAERVRAKVEGGTDNIYTIAKAVVRDTLTDALISLDADARLPDGPLSVTFTKDNGQTIQAKAGEILTVESFTYAVGELQLDPPSAVVTKSGGELPEPQTQTLVIPPPAPPEGVDNGTEVPSSFNEPFSPGPTPPVRVPPGGFPGF